MSTTSKFDYYSEVLNYLSNSTLKADPGTYSTYCNDGFTLAEEDLKLRGSGDLFGIKQSGDMSFKLANIQKDYELLIKAKADSEEVLDNIDKYEVLKNMLKESINMD